MMYKEKCTRYELIHTDKGDRMEICHKGYDETFYLHVIQKHFEQREKFNGYDTGYMVTNISTTKLLQNK